MLRWTVSKTPISRTLFLTYLLCMLFTERAFIILLHTALSCEYYVNKCSTLHLQRRKICICLKYQTNGRQTLIIVNPLELEITRTSDILHKRLLITNLATFVSTNKHVIINFLWLNLLKTTG
jgi:hypothetical protein